MTETLSQWQSFYLLMGTAAATLIGLMFVVVTFGANSVTRENAATVRAFIDPPFNHFFVVLVVAALLLMPLKALTVPATVFMLLGLAQLVVWFRSLGQLKQASQNESLDAADWFWYSLLPLTGHILLVGSAILLLLSLNQALIGLATAGLLLLAVGIQNAWDTVIWIALREVRTSGKS
ncbi:MAG: hypothetical protein IVW51_11380 [Thermaceae bacterium]|nr:hypothetical protein [Thermaceae bacterium]